jgi:hypothetical protein
MTTTATPGPAVFQAVWPIIPGGGKAGATDADLILAALADLPDVAARHRVQLTGMPKAVITDGRRYPGSAGARRVVLIETPAEQLPARNYHLGATA